ncbi:hypothetical protein LCGC14_1227020 [marine sediment metagenome]|uniref:Uncharacterized protein n=1 Tax=marine sediment metagenome TaxID=412755 RepID=A0A0F9NRW1_9ZZZZ
MNARHTHRFTAVPITGRGTHDGKEGLFGWRVECEHCGKKPQSGDVVEEIKTSWWKEIVPENKLVNIVYP